MVKILPLKPEGEIRTMKYNGATTKKTKGKKTTKKDHWDNSSCLRNGKYTSNEQATLANKPSIHPSISVHIVEIVQDDDVMLMWVPSIAPFMFGNPPVVRWCMEIVCVNVCFADDCIENIGSWRAVIGKPPPEKCLLPKTKGWIALGCAPEWYAFAFFKVRLKSSQKSYTIVFW